MFHHFDEYCGGTHTDLERSDKTLDYMSKEDYPYEYVRKERIIELYEKSLVKYANYQI